MSLGFSKFLLSLSIFDSSRLCADIYLSFCRQIHLIFSSPFLEVEWEAWEVWDPVSVQGKGLELFRVMTLGELQSTIILCCKPQFLVCVGYWLLQMVLKNLSAHF